MVSIVRAGTVAALPVHWSILRDGPVLRDPIRTNHLLALLPEWAVCFRIFRVGIAGNCPVPEFELLLP